MRSALFQGSGCKARFPGVRVRSKALSFGGRDSTRTGLSSRNHSRRAIPARVSSFSLLRGGVRPEAGPSFSSEASLFSSSEAGPSPEAPEPDGRRAMQCASQHFMPSETHRPPFATMLPAGGNVWDQAQLR